MNSPSENLFLGAALERDDANVSDAQVHAIAVLILLLYTQPQTHRTVAVFLLLYSV